MRPGFALPAVLVVAGALLVLAVGVLLVAGVERDTARSFVDRQRAELAARAGLEDIRGILTTEAANDDYIVLQSTLNATITPGSEPAPHLFIGRGLVSNGNFTQRYIPLFSTGTRPANAPLEAPEIEPLTGAANQRLDFQTLPYQDKVRAAWLPVLDEKGRTVARYAYWVEDLQGRVDPSIAGNRKGTGETHARVQWPFPAAGLNDQPESGDEPALDQIALFAVDPAATETAQGELGKTLLKNRALLVSPESQLAAAGIRPPLNRLKAEDPATKGKTGDLVDPKARAVERGLVAGTSSYQEQPLVPFAVGIDPAAAGKPKLNLNKLLATGGDAAVGEMADFIKQALPKFEQRKGGFPEDYLKTLAANALDYADADSESTLSEGSYRGIDSFPLVSEIVLQVEYQGKVIRNNRHILKFRMRLYAELWNMSNQPVSGTARCGYEVGIPLDGIGALANGADFDSPDLLDDPACAVHNLAKINGRYYGPAVTVNNLLPDQYLFIPAGEASYTIDVGPSSSTLTAKTPIYLKENESAARGLGLEWNGQLVDRVPRIVRDAWGLTFEVGVPDVHAKAAIPGHTYGSYGNEINNMGDPRISRYILTSRAAENEYPQNASPYRRNVRRGTIYNFDPSSRKTRHYGRVLPSEWPDGGHDSPIAPPGALTVTFPILTDDSIAPTAPQFSNHVPASKAENAPQRISNRGRFHSATELGRAYDPVMWLPTYSDLPDDPGSGARDTAILRGDRINNIKPLMPETRNQWPTVAVGNTPATEHGGGNSLRIGRPEHPKFDFPGLRAAHLLDLFHAGESGSEDATKREGGVVRINGHVNLNTASGEAIRALAAGLLKQDPELRRVTNWSHQATNSNPAFAPATGKIDLGTPTREKMADRIAEAIIRSRPFASAAELAAVRDADGLAVFGNPEVYRNNPAVTFDVKTIQWTDAAAEEVFARVYDASTFRSRNFRVWVVGQAIMPTTSATATPEVLAEVRKVFSVFADPGERNPDGTINPANHKIRITHENDF
jgi:hypothetical protein